MHKLNSEVNKKALKELEWKLHIQFPQIYKNFLQMYNGGELFIPGTALSEIYIPSNGSKKEEFLIRMIDFILNEDR
ncbi:SMI1/KNR4 family protein [Priestia megaterium]|uniref:SMI1/KNR4 family protein n=1 Tax=Priestia TaxID=2800373 RepID=UPI003857F3A3